MMCMCETRATLVLNLKCLEKIRNRFLNATNRSLSTVAVILTMVIFMYGLS